MTPRTAWLALLTLILLATPVLAADPLGQKELSDLLKGNTAKFMKNATEESFRAYFDPSGELRWINRAGKPATTSWHVDESGKLCIVIKQQACLEVVKKELLGYDVLTPQGEVRWTIEKIQAGNPYKL